MADSPYRYLGDFRASPEAETVRSEAKQHGMSQAVALTRLAAVHWHKMSEAEKSVSIPLYKWDQRIDEVLCLTALCRHLTS